MTELPSSCARTLRTALYLLLLCMLGLILAGDPPARAAAGGAAPTIKIIKAPERETTSTKAVFRFASSASSTWCRRDRLRFRRCRRGVTYTQLRPGRHTFTVRARRRGRAKLVRHHWTVVRTTAPAAAEQMLAVSAKADRSDPRPLAGTAQTLGTSMYVFTTPSIDVKRVRFYLDDPSMHRAPRRIESEAPFDFNVTAHDGTASAFEVSTLSTGSHTITAAQEQTNGRTRILSATFNVVAPPTSAAPVFGRTLVFEDNFDGAAVDTSNWSMYNGPGHDGNGLRRPSAFSVANGLLTVTASWNGQNITSGGMAHNENYTYGSFEVRVRTQPDPTAQTSGVVLTWPQSGRHPYDGENDWYETGTGASRFPFSSFIHHHRATWSGDQTYIHHNADAADWQVMRMDWGPDAIRVYRNGVYAGALTNKAQIPDVPHHATIQLDAFSNRPLAGTVQMQIDYIRIYR